MISVKDNVIPNVMYRYYYTLVRFFTTKQQLLINFIYNILEAKESGKTYFAII